MPSEKPRLVIRTSPDVINEFERICKLEDRSMSNMGERIIKQFITNYQAQERREEQKNKLEQSSISKTG